MSHQHIHTQSSDIYIHVHRTFETALILICPSEPKCFRMYTILPHIDVKHTYMCTGHLSLCSNCWRQTCLSELLLPLLLPQTQARSSVQLSACSWEPYFATLPHHLFECSQVAKLLYTLAQKSPPEIFAKSASIRGKLFPFSAYFESRCCSHFESRCCSHFESRCCSHFESRCCSHSGIW